MGSHGLWDEHLVCSSIFAMSNQVQIRKCPLTGLLTQGQVVSFSGLAAPPHGFKWITHPLATSKQWSLEGHPLTRLACRRFRYTWQSNRDMDFGPACDGYTDVLSIKNGDFQTSILEY